MPTQIQPDAFRSPRIRLTVSSRDLRPDLDILTYLRVFYLYADVERIDSVFGSTTRPCRLWGGRTYRPEASVTPEQIDTLRSAGIHLALTLTNHFFDSDAYKEALPLLEEHQGDGNTIICVNDDLARNIRRDFPTYHLKASVIKNVRTVDGVLRALELYDQVVLPMELNDDFEFLEKVPEKERVTLFGNATCAFTCPARTCYRGFSQANFGRPVTASCSQEVLPREVYSSLFFDVRRFLEMGFRDIKLVPIAPPSAADVTRELQQERDVVEVV